MVERYEDWVQAVHRHPNPDRYVLETFFEVVEQFRESYKSTPSTFIDMKETVLFDAMACVERYLAELAERESH